MGKLLTWRPPQAAASDTPAAAEAQARDLMAGCPAEQALVWALGRAVRQGEMAFLVRLRDARRQASQQGLDPDRGEACFREAVAYDPVPLTAYLAWRGLVTGELSLAEARDRVGPDGRDLLDQFRACPEAQALGR